MWRRRGGRCREVTVRCIGSARCHQRQQGWSVGYLVDVDILRLAAVGARPHATCSAQVVKDLFLPMYFFICHLLFTIKPHPSCPLRLVDHLVANTYDIPRSLAPLLPLSGPTHPSASSPTLKPAVRP